MTNSFKSVHPIFSQVLRIFIKVIFFERELASLVALQVVSSKEEGEEEKNFLTSFNKPRLEA